MRCRHKEQNGTSHANGDHKEPKMGSLTLCLQSLLFCLFLFHFSRLPFLFQYIINIIQRASLYAIKETIQV